MDQPNDEAIRTSLAPWLTVRECALAVEFYKAAFDAVETYRLENAGAGAVVKLSVEGAEFWVSEGAAVEGAESVGGGTVRMILTVADPDAMFARAVEAGATEVFAVGESHGWRLGRIVDPFGLHWEVGRPLAG